MGLEWRQETFTFGGFEPNPMSDNLWGSTYTPDFSDIIAVSKWGKESFVERSAERLDDNKDGQTSTDVHEPCENKK